MSQMFAEVVGPGWRKALVQWLKFLTWPERAIVIACLLVITMSVIAQFRGEMWSPWITGIWAGTMILQLITSKLKDREIQVWKGIAELLGLGKQETGRLN